MITQEHLTHATQELLNRAIAIAQEHKHPTLQPLHMLRAGIEHNFCKSLFEALDVSIRELETIVEHCLKDLPTVSGNQFSLDPATGHFLKACQEFAQQLGDTYISVEHVVLAWIAGYGVPTAVRAYFKEKGITTDQVLRQMKEIRQGKRVDNPRAENQYQLLQKYCKDITEQARSGKLDPVIGRHEEIRRVIQILSRRTKNNPVLIGEPGVGKTAIVEGIAQRIVNNDVPESLKNKKIYSLDLGLLVAGTKFQGEFEERIKGVLAEIENNNDEVVLFIDELHMLVGTGSSGGGGMDASNLLKPALARGDLHCIGATTLKEYKQYIEKDAALERRFQQVMVHEPTITDAVSILRGLKERYELHHGVRIKDQALVDAVTLSAKNIPDRFLPDKAIDLIDEAAAKVKMSIDSQPESVDKLERQIRQLEIEKVALAKEKDKTSKVRLQTIEKELAEAKEEHQVLFNQWNAEKAPLEKVNTLSQEIEKANYLYHMAERAGDYAQASEIKYGKITQLEQELADAQKQMEKRTKNRLVKQEVDERDVASVLARWTQIPVEKLEQSEQQKILAMEDMLKKSIIGQDEAVQEVTHAIQVHRAGLTDPKKPVGTFLFLGPTGVGKTEVTKTLADFLFNDSNKMVRIDMSEYMEKHAVARLIGSPPGYVGYEQGGQLTEHVRRQPYSVILFDEIEKAHPDVFNIFLQILDEGRLTDGQGRTVSFKNCIIIMTSNIGSDVLLKADEVTDDVKVNVSALLNKAFRPEFLNRIDATVFFKRLTQENVAQIAQIQIAQLQNRLQEKNIALHVKPAAVAKLAGWGYVKEFGARPLKRVIQSKVVVPVSQHMLRNPNIKKVTVDVKGDVLQVG